jgi:hypothetical protein
MIEIRTAGVQAKVRATPKAYLSGQQVPPDQIPIQAIKPKYDDLWKEVGEALR